VRSFLKARREAAAWAASDRCGLAFLRGGAADPIFAGSQQEEDGMEEGEEEEQEEEGEESEEMSDGAARALLSWAWDPSDSDGVPWDSEAEPWDNDGASSHSDGAPSDSDGAPADSDGAPADSNGAPADSDCAPADSDGAPSDSDGASSHSDAMSSHSSDVVLMPGPAAIEILSDDSDDVEGPQQQVRRCGGRAGRPSRIAAHQLAAATLWRAAGVTWAVQGRWRASVMQSALHIATWRDAPARGSSQPEQPPASPQPCLSRRPARRQRPHCQPSGRCPARRRCPASASPLLSCLRRPQGGTWRAMILPESKDYYTIVEALICLMYDMHSAEDIDGQLHFELVRLFLDRTDATNRAGRAQRALLIKRYAVLRQLHVDQAWGAVVRAMAGLVR
jgi:hypothetical protein